jgi:hypothetical protein
MKQLKEFYKMIDAITTQKAKEAFENRSEPGTCLMLVSSVTGDYYTGSEFADNCGPDTNRELVGVKRLDGTVRYFGSLKQ